MLFVGIGTGDNGMIIDRDTIGSANTSTVSNGGYLSSAMDLNNSDSAADLNMLNGGHLSSMNGQPTLTPSSHQASSLHPLHSTTLSNGQHNAANLVRMQNNSSAFHSSDMLSSGHSDDSSIASPETFKLSPQSVVECGVYKREMIDNDCY
jgi:hypothetical protein